MIPNNVPSRVIVTPSVRFSLLPCPLILRLCEQQLNSAMLELISFSKPIKVWMDCSLKRGVLCAKAQCHGLCVTILGHGIQLSAQPQRLRMTLISTVVGSNHCTNGSSSCDHRENASYQCLIVVEHVASRLGAASRRKGGQQCQHSHQTCSEQRSQQYSINIPHFPHHPSCAPPSSNCRRDNRESQDIRNRRA